MRREDGHHMENRTHPRTGAFLPCPEELPILSRMTRMKSWTLVCTTLLLGAVVSVRGQSIGRIKQSIDRATAPRQADPGAAPASGQPTAPPPVDPATAAAITAAEKQRNAKASEGADQRVIEFLRKRIDEGSADAAFDLAKRYEKGRGVPADAAEARRFYALAAERGNSDAQWWLASHPEPVSAAQRTNAPTAGPKTNAPVTKPGEGSDSAKAR
jgi:hypothetical protein